MLLTVFAPCVSPVDSTAHTPMDGTAKGLQTLCMLKLLKYSRGMSVELCSMLKPHQKGGSKPRPGEALLCPRVRGHLAQEGLMPLVLAYEKR